MMRKVNGYSIVFVAVAVAMLVPDRARAAPPVLDVGSHPPALAPVHFPDRAHAVVWRNWQLVEPARIATVLGTTEANVKSMAESMGLPASGPIPEDYSERMMITIVRRNWHLLPYEQLLVLLDMDASQLAKTLHEDDFLFIKLGNLKPAVEPVRYAEPTNAVLARAAEIRGLVEQHFGESIHERGEPRFAFIDALSDMANAPPPPADPVAHKRNGLRLIYSYFALFGDPLASQDVDPFPDGLLARLADMGVNGIWLHTVLRDMAPGRPEMPGFGQGHEQRVAGLRRLVERADRYGIGVYLYLNEPRSVPHAFFDGRDDVAGMAGVRERDLVALCTSDPRVRQWMSDSLTYVFKQVSNLAGVFTITASENLTSCASHGRHNQCPRCAKHSAAEIIADVNTIIEEAVHAGNPNARVIVWDWGWNGHGDASQFIPLLPKNVWLMSVSEWSLPIERGGVKTNVGEYSMSAVGPGPRASRHWQLAKQHGLKTVAKVQLNNTWELSSIPALPVLELVAEHESKRAKLGLDGTMLSWTLGGYPSLNLRIAARFADDPDAQPEQVLHELAVERYGQDGAASARRAWRQFSDAFRRYPYHISLLYNGPQQMGPANPLYATPTGFSATMTGIPYDDVNHWRGPYPPDILEQQFRKVADGWAAGTTSLATAVEQAPDEKRAEALGDLHIAKAAGLHFASVANQVKFVRLRDALIDQANPPTPPARAVMTNELQSLIDEEIRLARALHQLTRIDSRIGFEAANQYFYTPLDLVEKVITCEYAREALAKSE